MANKLKVLINKINTLKNNKVLRTKISLKLREFKNCQDWFSELCYCIMTANSKAESAMQLQKQINFRNISQEQLRLALKGKVRFHGNKASYILQARHYQDIKTIINGKDTLSARQWLIENIKGLGMKEASHFLRNVGYTNVAILDRHILSVLKEYGLVKINPPLTHRNYLYIEEKLREIAKLSNLNLAELDLYLWFLKTNKVLK